MSSVDAPARQEAPARPGDLVVVGFVAAVLVFLYVLAIMVYASLREEDASVLIGPVARLTHSAFAAVGILAALDARRAGYPHWKRYLVAALIPVVQVASLLQWFINKRRTWLQTVSVDNKDTDKNL